MERKLIKTADGSFTLHVEEIDETYHSRHGAIQEAQHVFIESGLNQLDKAKIRILEVGFGTGLNAFLTQKNHKTRGAEIFYTGLEAYPVGYELVKKMDYAKELGVSNETFLKLHECNWNEWIQIEDHFHLKKLEQKLEDFEPTQNFDLVYFDAFGFRAQPEMWNIELLEKCTKNLNPNGIFVTYSAKGQLKRDLKTLGLDVEKIPGPPGKREMIRATKI